MGKRAQFLALSPDPRDASLVQQWKRIPPHPDEAPPDWYSMLTLIMGMGGIFMRSPLMAWVAMYASLASIANVRMESVDIKQILTSVMVSVMGLVMTYTAINQQRAKAQQAASP